MDSYIDSTLSSGTSVAVSGLGQEVLDSGFLGSSVGFRACFKRLFEGNSP